MGCVRPAHVNNGELFVATYYIDCSSFSVSIIPGYNSLGQVINNVSKKLIKVSERTVVVHKS